MPVLVIRMKSISLLSMGTSTMRFTTVKSNRGVSMTAA